MLWGAFVRINISEIVLLLILLPSLAMAEQPCPLDPDASVPMRIGEADVPTIPVEINDRKELLFIDTGAPISLMSAGYVVELQLPRKPYPRGLKVMANGTSPDEVATVDTLSLGALTGHNLKFFIVPSIELRSTLAGSFGVDFLQSWDVDFDFSQQKFNLISPDKCHGNPVYWAKRNYFRVPMLPTDERYLRVSVLLDGKELKADLDTGSSETAMNLELAKRLFGLHEERLPTTAFAPRQEQMALLTGNIYEHKFRSLDIGGFRIASPTVLLASNLHFGDTDMVIGMSDLRNLHFYVSYRDQAIYLAPADKR